MEKFIRLWAATAAAILAAAAIFPHDRDRRALIAVAILLSLVAVMPWKDHLNR